MAALTGAGVALRNQISRTLYDNANKRHSFLGLLKGFDNMYGMKTRFTLESDLSGEKAQVEFRKSLPTVAGVNALTESTLSNLALAAQINFAAVAGTMQYSHYHGREDIRKALKNKLANDPKSMVPHLKVVGDAIGEAYLKKFQEDMFPEDNYAPTRASGGAAGDAAEDKILGLGYPLQGGYATNTTVPGSGTYTYLDIDLNSTALHAVPAEAKAVQAGTNSAGFGVPTLSNLRKKIYMPLKYRGANIDLGVCNTNQYDYMLSQAEGAVVINQADRLEYGGEVVKIGPIWWMCEDRLDALDDAGSPNYSEFYVLDTSTVEFRLNDKEMSVDFVDNYEAPSLLTALSYVEAMLIVKHPRMNGHGYNITYA